ncbi:MAG TPA: adenylyltransferase/cytidyltransferase family protein [Savagea sp.]
MKVYGENELDLDGAIVTIGAFDGLHRGHQQLIQKAQQRAELWGVPLVVYTFDPPPKVFFQNKQLLTPLEEKCQFLRNMQVDYTIFARFDEKYAARSAEKFIEELQRLRPMEVWVGDDFKFGKDQRGTAHMLREHFCTHEFEEITCRAGLRISSSRIRELLEENQQALANDLLNREAVAMIRGK